MKFSLRLTAALLFGSGLLVAQDVNQPMPSSANPYQGHGGPAYGARTALNDLERTAIARATETVGVQLAALAKARLELTAAVFAQPVSSATVASRAQALADAEYQLALARADAFGKLKVELKASTPAKLQAIQGALNTNQ
jgi:hypothetical protein